MRYVTRPDGVRLAFQYSRGAAPTVVFLPGFGGDMTGDKACYLAAAMHRRGNAVLLLDYSGHGASGGRFEDGTVGIWCDDALAVIDQKVHGEMILVGSSMGGWIAMLIALRRPSQVVGLVGIAAAPDFTERRVWDTLDAQQRSEIVRAGATLVPTDYHPGLHISRRLIEDGRRNALLDAPIAIRCPVRLLQGQRDPDVQWSLAERIASLITGDDVVVTLIKDGDHHLSRPSDLRVLGDSIGQLLGEDGA